MPTLNRRTDGRKSNRAGSNNRPFYQSHRWHRLSLDFRKANPLCAACLKIGIVELAECTDHIIPLTEWIRMGRDPYDISNLQSLSNSCHSKKTYKERRSGWNKKNQTKRNEEAQ